MLVRRRPALRLSRLRGTAGSRALSAGAAAGGDQPAIPGKRELRAARDPGRERGGPRAAARSDHPDRADARDRLDREQDHAYGEGSALAVHRGRAAVAGLRLRRHASDVLFRQRRRSAQPQRGPGWYALRLQHRRRSPDLGGEVERPVLPHRGTRPAGIRRVLVLRALGLQRLGLPQPPRGNGDGPLPCTALPV